MRHDHLRYSNHEWRVVTEREYDGTPKYADERDHPVPYEPTAMDLQRAEEIRQALESHKALLNAMQPFIVREPRKGGEL